MTTTHPNRGAIRILCLAFVGALLLFSTGCTDRQIEMAENAVAQANRALAVATEQLAQGEQTIAKLRAQVEQHAELAKSIGGEQAERLIKELNRQLDDAEQALPALRDAASRAANGLHIAEQAVEKAKDGARWYEYLALGATLVGTVLGGSTGVAVARNRKLGTALRVTAELADTLKTNSDADKEILAAAAKTQDDLGVRKIIRDHRK